MFINYFSWVVALPVPWKKRHLASQSHAAMSFILNDKPKVASPVGWGVRLVGASGMWGKKSPSEGFRPGEAVVASSQWNTVGPVSTPGRVFLILEFILFFIYTILELLHTEAAKRVASILSASDFLSIQEQSNEDVYIFLWSKSTTKSSEKLHSGTSISPDLVF